MKGKKILFICNSDWFFVSHRLPIAVECRKNDFEIHLATNFTDKNIRDDLENLGFKLHPLNINRSSFNPYKILMSFAQIFFIIHKINPNIVHSITIKPVILAGISLLFFPKISFVAAIPGLGYLNTINTLKARIILNFIKLAYRIAFLKRNKIVIFQNNYDMSYISKICSLNKKNSILIRGSGVNLEEFKPQENYQEKPIILFAARLLKSKGILEFVKAAKILKEIRFVVVGKLDFENPDCISKELLNEWVNKEIIEYWGFQKNMQSIISKATLVTLPSFYSEGLPKVLIEAAACGKPIITTNYPGCRDAIIDGETGFLIPAKDEISLVKAIQKILSSAQLQKDMSVAARKFAEENFSIQAVINIHLKIYYCLLNQNQIKLISK